MASGCCKFEAIVMGGLPVTANAIVAASDNAVVRFGENQHYAIGYASLGHLSPGVKALAIEGGQPLPQTAGGGRYPLTQDIWLLSSDPPRDAVEEFVGFVLCAAGQQVMGRRFGTVR